MKSNKSILSQYSDKKIITKQDKAKALPLMTTYEQRYKGMVREVTEPKKLPTLDEKIKARDAKPDSIDTNTRIPIVIGGSRYLLGSSSELSESHASKIAKLANSYLDEAKSTNPGLTNSKAAILALIEACEEVIDLRNDLSSLKTELMYYQRQDFINKSTNQSEPTPMEILAENNREEK